MDQYKYDIALSFLARDEHIAMEIYGRLKDRYNIFVYSEQQKNLAGKDGEGAFKKVFEAEAKLVVVLFRSEWGSTPFTRIEQAGIRDRAYGDGYNFVTFVALEERPLMPDWFPKQRLYVGYERFGIDTVVAVIDARAQEAQIPSKALTVLEQAQALERKRTFETEKERYLTSHEAVQSAQRLARELQALLKVHFAGITSAMPSMHMQDHSNADQFAITGNGPSMLVDFDPGYSNSVKEAELRAVLYSGAPPLRGKMFFGDSKRLARINLAIDRTESSPLCWRHEGKHYTNEQAVELISEFWLKRQTDGRTSSNSPFSRSRG